jgi:hypothetical protein
MKNNNEASKNNNNNNNKNVNQIIPRTFLIDATILANTKKSITSHNNTILQASLDQLLKGADGYLPEAPFSVVEKTQLPPSGIMTIYHYSIPDKKNLENMIDRVKTLSISTYRIQL